MIDVLPKDLQAKAVRTAPPAPLPNSYWVVPGRCLAGPYPRSVDDAVAREKVKRLLDVGVTVFIDLTERGEVAPYDHLLIGKARHVRIPIRDFDVSSERQMTQILDEMDRVLAEGGCVYLHCFAGLGRTGTVVGCWLVRHGLSGREALRAIGELRRQTAFPDSASPQTDAQARFVRRWRD
jgi:hypothetical protein